MLKKYYSRFGGILIGGLYGLLMRIIFGLNFKGDFADLFSITFVWLVPIIVGLTPLMFSTKEDLSRIEYRFLKPILAVLTFFILCYWAGREDIICILIISIPFLIVAGISGVILGGSIIRYRQKKRNFIFNVFSTIYNWNH